MCFKETIFMLTLLYVGTKYILKQFIWQEELTYIHMLRD